MINKKNNVLFLKPIALTLCLLTAMLISSHSFAGQVTFTVDPASTCIKAGLCSGSNSSSGSNSASDATVPYTDEQISTLDKCQDLIAYGDFNGTPGYYNNSCNTLYTSKRACTDDGGVGCVYVDSSSVLHLKSLKSCAGKSGVNVGSWVFFDVGQQTCGVVSTRENDCTAAMKAANSGASNLNGCAQMPKQN